MSNKVKIDQIVGGNNSIRVDYITLDGYEDPSLIANTGTVYAKEVDGYAELHYYDDYSYYVDGTDGNDSYNGLTVDTPKLTLQAVFDLIPYHVRHNVDVNLTGTFTSDTAILDKYVEDGYYINIDGGDGYDVVAGPYTSTGVNNSYIDSASKAGFIYTGYWVKIIDGAKANYIRGIRENNTTRTYYNKIDMSGMSIGDKFFFMKPLTKLTSSSSIKIACSGSGSVVVQRLYLDRGTKIWSDGCLATIILTHLIAVDSLNGAAYNFENCKKVKFDCELYNNGAFTETTSVAGVYTVDGVHNMMTILNNINDLSMSNVYFSNIKINNCGIGLISRGSIFRYGMIISNSISIIDVSGSGNEEYAYSFHYNSGYGYNKITNSFSPLASYNDGRGLLLVSSSIGSQELYVDFSAQSGIELIHSGFLALNPIYGSNNRGGGVYGYSASVMMIKESISNLTIDGTIGEWTMDEIGQTNWSSIQAGTPSVDVDIMTIAKERAT
jgi:hypothetical protein